jgi:hypothetical protein
MKTAVVNPRVRVSQNFLDLPLGRGAKNFSAPANPPPPGELAGQLAVQPALVARLSAVATDLCPPQPQGRFPADGPPPRFSFLRLHPVPAPGALSEPRHLKRQPDGARTAWSEPVYETLRETIETPSSRLRDRPPMRSEHDRMTLIFHTSRKRPVVDGLAVRQARHWNPGLGASR